MLRSERAPHSVRSRVSGNPGRHKHVHARLQRAMHSNVSKSGSPLSRGRTAMLWLATLATLAMGIVASAHSASPQTARTIRVVVSVPAGGAIDALVRVLADEIARTTGQTIVIDSRPG